MRAFYKDTYGCRAELVQYLGRETTRLTIRNYHGSIILRKEYRTWKGARIAMGKWSDGWKNALTGKLT